MESTITGKKVKLSDYALIVPTVDRTYIVSSSLTGMVVHINTDEYISELERLQRLSDKGDFLLDEGNDMQSFFYMNGILVDIETNEYELVMYTYERKIVRDMSLNLTIIPTRQCNLRCIYCYENFRDEFMNEDVYHGVLNFVGSKICARECNSVNIGLFGGEPFLPFDSLIAFLRRAKELCDETGIAFEVGATTNFELVTPDRFQMLSEVNCKTYQVTVDGVMQTHDKYRPRVDGNGSFSKIIRVCEKT